MKKIDIYTLGGEGNKILCLCSEISAACFSFIFSHSVVWKWCDDIYDFCLEWLYLLKSRYGADTRKIMLHYPHERQKIKYLKCAQIIKLKQVSGQKLRLPPGEGFFYICLK